MIELEVVDIATRPMCEEERAGPPPVSWYESASVMWIGCVVGL